MHNVKNKTPMLVLALCSLAALNCNAQQKDSIRSKEVSFPSTSVQSVYMPIAPSGTTPLNPIYKKLEPSGTEPVNKQNLEQQNQTGKAEAKKQ